MANILALVGDSLDNAHQYAKQTGALAHLDRTSETTGNVRDNQKT